MVNLILGKLRPVPIPAEKWGALCDALEIPPDAPIDEVIRKAAYYHGALIAARLALYEATIIGDEGA